MSEVKGASLSGVMFKVIKSVCDNKIAARLGRLSAKSTTIDTPHYLAITSRGVVPHLSQDTFARDTQIKAVFAAIEDFIEKYPYANPPLLAIEDKDGRTPFRRFTSLPSQTLLVLGARRTPPVAAPAATANTNSTVAICTAIGFRKLDADDYAEAAERLGADIIVALGDIPYERALVPKRVEKAVDRQIDWLKNHITRRDAQEQGPTDRAALIAPLLPISCAKQQYYVDWLESHTSDISGLAIYDIETPQDLPDSLHSFPRLAFTTPPTPHEVLRHISLGMDVLTVPFVGAATDAGIALDFDFGSDLAIPEDDSRTDEPMALGIDMWSTDHAIDLSPLTKDCTCYACTDHHRAYLQHLLAAKEMLGWVLLQIHNHHIIERFFLAIRASIANDSFEQDVARFNKFYEPQLPEKTGRGPRVRGYQFKSEGPSEPKKNVSNFTVYDDKKNRLKEETPIIDKMAAVDLESQGFAEQR